MHIGFEKAVMMYLGENTDERIFFDFICSEYQVILFGGIVRDYIFGLNKIPRDFDLVLDHIPQDSWLFTASLKNCKVSSSIQIIKNQFDGYKVICNQRKFDIWFLNDTWAFRMKLLEPSPDNLLKSVYLNIDAYGYCWAQHSFLDHCDKKLKPKEIDIELEDNPNVLLNLIRARVLSGVYGLPLSDKIEEKIKEQKETDDFEEVCRVEQLKHYGKIICNL